jgi:hypothetical protein
MYIIQLHDKLNKIELISPGVPVLGRFERGRAGETGLPGAGR